MEPERTRKKILGRFWHLWSQSHGIAEENYHAHLAQDRLAGLIKVLLVFIPSPVVYLKA